MTTTPETDHAYARSSPARSHTAQVMQAVGRAIVSGRYPQGSVLPGDTELMAQFGVSRTVLREAVKMLSGKGLLGAKARIGTTVRDRSDWNLFDPDVLIWHAEDGFDADFLAAIAETRLALEPEAAALAARRRTPEQLEALYVQVEAMADAVSARGFVAADLAFHLAVADAAANPFLRSISTLIEVALVAVLTRSSPFDVPGGKVSSADEHRAIADAIAGRDGEAARAGMRLVIEQGIRRSTAAGEGSAR